MVETVLKPSAIHGLGVFLAQPVPKGGLIWRFDSRIDRVYTLDELASLPAHVQAYLKTWLARVKVPASVRVAVDVDPVSFF